MTWAERRKHDLMRSHRIEEYFNPYDAERAERLIDQIIEYEALAHVTEKQGGSAEDMEKIEEARWPVSEVLRQLDSHNVLHCQDTLSATG